MNSDKKQEIIEFLKRNRILTIEELEYIEPEQFKEAVIEFRNRLDVGGEKERLGYCLQERNYTRNKKR